jgi:hypothetical protein
MMMIRYFKFRNALRRLVKENNELLEMLAQAEMHELKYEKFNLTWDDGDGWRGWVYNEKHNRYFFNDVPQEGIMQVWDENWKWEESLG